MIRVTLPLLLIGVAFAGDTHKFSHFNHVKKEELVCSDCHGKTMNSTSLSQARAGLTLKSCDKCHSDDSNFSAPKPIVLVDPSFRIERAVAPDFKFNHKAHAASKVACASCHGELADPEIPAQSASAGSRLGMRDCMECHLQKADVSCLSCHDKVEKPLSHMLASWKRSEGHGLKSGLAEKDCAMCHEDGQVTTCSDCHLGDDAKKVHGLNYRFNHGIDVKFKKLDCAVCHAPLDQFCADCHEGKGRQ